jgi:hypothetical protein
MALEAFMNVKELTPETLHWIAIEMKAAGVRFIPIYSAERNS